MFHYLNLTSIEPIGLLQMLMRFADNPILDAIDADFFAKGKILHQINIIRSIEAFSKSQALACLRTFDS